MKWTEWLAQTQQLVTSWRGQQHLSAGDVGQLCWAAGIDPGKATGLSVLVYLVPPPPIEVSGNGFSRDLLSQVGGAVDGWAHTIKALEIQQSPGGRLLDTYDATGAIVLTYWAEDFYSRGPEDEPAMVRRIISRIRGMGGVWYGSPDWDGAQPDSYAASGLGDAGISIESFKVREANGTDDYVSPVRVISMIRYALEEEFEVEIKSNTPGDAKNMFGPLQFKYLGMKVSGPDHVKDALSHGMFGIRKAYS